MLLDYIEDTTFVITVARRDFHFTIVFSKRHLPHTIGAAV